jgi:hypothetical protein
VTLEGERACPSSNLFTVVDASVYTRAGVHGGGRVKDVKVARFKGALAAEQRYRWIAETVPPGETVGP